MIQYLKNLGRSNSLSYFVDLMSRFIHYLYEFTASVGYPSYALAIIILGIIVRILLFPLSLKQMRSMIGMSDIQPELKELQARYKNNRQKLSEEMNKLYQEHNVNPMAGCLPILIQMPILYAIFQAMRTYDYNEHASFLWIDSLKNTDPLYIFPALLVILMFLQQKLSMSKEAINTNPSMKVMLYVMPLMMGVISVNLPSGVGIYWITTSFIMLIQQIFMNKQREKEKAIRQEARKKREAERKLEVIEKQKAGQNKNKKRERIAQAKARKKVSSVATFDEAAPKAIYQPKKK